MSYIHAEQELMEKRLDFKSSALRVCTPFAIESLLEFALRDVGLSHFYDRALKRGISPHKILLPLREGDLISYEYYQQPKTRIIEAIDWMRQRADLEILVVERQLKWDHSYSLDFQSGNDRATVYDLQVRPPEIKNIELLAKRVEKRGGPNYEWFAISKGRNSVSPR